MKKKLISLVLAGAMLLGMAGCAEKPGASEEGKKEDKGSTDTDGAGSHSYFAGSNRMSGRCADFRTGMGLCI